MRAAGALRGITTLRDRSEYRMAASEQSLGQRRHGKFFSTAQFELLSRNRFEKLEDARAAITEWIDVFITPNPDKRRVVERVRSNTNCVGRCVSRGHNQPVHESGANSLSRVKTSHPIVDESVRKPH